jgi:peptidoglycan/xylan/chitin deacetylase (PgdA/CDA1 family)
MWLVLYYGGLYSFIRWRRRKVSRGAILLYHLVNDVSEDVLTVSTRRFAQHLVTLRRHYRVIASEQLVAHVAAHENLEETAVAIHFDDCYRDVRTNASPLLAAAGMPAAVFISSGCVDTSRVFGHDELDSPHRFENLCGESSGSFPASVSALPRIR